MKRVLLAVAILASVFPGLRTAEAAVDVSIDFFYDNLNNDGSWVEVGDYGYCWQPSVAVNNTSWRPYSDGYWAYTDVGWTWVSYEDFGWATYHYGRWLRLRGRGWLWVPGREWGPAWVSWRTGGDYIGWAPLPPRRAGEYWDEKPITSRVDLDLDIGPASYNFVDIRYIGEPVLRERIFAPEQNVTYISKTVNVTNITYTNSTVYNYGPDYATVSRYSTRPIQRLSIERATNVDPSTAVRSKSVVKVQGDKLIVAAPQQFQKPTKSIAPKVVKEKIAQAPVEKGWEPVSDPKAQAELKEKMRKEDPKSVPPPSVQAATSATAATSASAAPATAAASAGATATSPPASNPAPSLDKSRNKKRENAAPKATIAPSTETTAPTVPPKETPTKQKRERPPAAVPEAARVAPPPAPDVEYNRPAQDAAKPDARVEKPKHDRGAEMLKKGPPHEPATSPSP